MDNIEKKGGTLPTEARLAIATVMEKTAKETKEGLRAQLLGEMSEEWEKSRSDRRPITLEGMSRTGNDVSIKVGTVSLTMNPAHWEIVDYDAFMEYARGAGLTAAAINIDAGRESEAANILKSAGFGAFTYSDSPVEKWGERIAEGDPVDMATGELVPGIAWVNERPKGLRVTGGRAENSLESRVELALRVLGAGSISALLEGGADGEE